MTIGSPSPWRRRTAWARLLRRSGETLAVCWLLLEPLAVWRPNDLRWGYPGYFILIGASLAIGAFLARPKQSFTRKLALSDTKITVEVSDILSQTGNVVIGVTDVFDTELGDVIRPSSLQGKFQSRFFPDTNELDKCIRESLEGQAYHHDRDKTRGKNNRYPIGTVAVIRRGDLRFFLCAYSEMGANFQAQSDICKLMTSLESCWESIRVAGQHEPVHIAIVGSGLSRIGLPRSLLLQFIVLSFLDKERQSSITQHLYVHVLADDIEHIDFVDLEHWLAGLTRAA
jgi:hypothetical protein